MSKFKSQLGVTLLEILLVLAIGSSLLLFAVNQYQKYREQQYPQQLRLQIDQLFQAALGYYQANCKAEKISGGTVVTPTQLQQLGFLSSRWSPINPLVSDYIIQYNAISPSSRFIYTCYNGTCEPPQAIDPATKNVMTYHIQVAAKLVTTSPNLINAYKTILGADCVSSANGQSVQPCSAGSPGNYVVWTRSPSLATYQSNSNLWPSLHQLRIFNLQYTHDSMYEMIHPGVYGDYQCGG